jgi:hypothetical protein
MPSLHETLTGPVDLAVIHFEGSQFNGDIAPALIELHDEGIVRIIDCTLVRKEADGSTSVLEVADAEVADAFARITDSQLDLLSDEDLQRISDGLDANSSALIIVWENTWTRRLATAVRESRGELVELMRIPREYVQAALAALDEE